MSARRNSDAPYRTALPLADNEGYRFPDDQLRAVQPELADKFGGLAAHMQSPAEGIWASGDSPKKDDIVIVEVMADEIDQIWWSGFRKRVEKSLKQDEILIRAQESRRL